jgi:murein DD-endopeptidase MepM/ murein hydrolase activator NlpD
MNIIIVPDAHTLPRSIDLKRGRVRLAITGGIALAALFFMAIGVAATLLVASPRRHELRQVSELRTALLGQREKLASFERDAHRNLDALALQLGQLQAQATRLNALGERLTQVGKLDDGEFDFGSMPGIGGPEVPAADAGSALPFQQGLDELGAEFERQLTQLEVLESLLRDREIDKALLPSGMPVAQGYVSSGFGGRTDPINGHSGVHLGVDFGAPAGSAILAVADGLVTYADTRSGYGKVIEIDHGNGFVTRYAHASAFIAHPGQRVRAGEAIAKVGSTGRSTGPHCHFEVWRNGRAVNPMSYVRGKAQVARG